ncbi:electron transfer flavoprotein subunit alpha/FixB family protein [candidate division NPL-UPA2 bacterium Unc8]|uniref:Electron transfer flavoprotein subunit alpha/FixB family protein n=1 Tax=candidate division NPL-UPA2 bacterium Unc8 TaxID=1980939 RepID=A0A399FXW0_UNCN2|nr:Caffeyl-CoA reductase-Etf complex subunit CarE [Bacillota bacterium]RII00052.1 MAG: electron transfer flavoprotein subunit alpha/FixB family protein [candidate division NPL-UPA2 bacterium Unc8]
MEKVRELENCSGVWIFIEQRDGMLQQVGLELLGKGRQLADVLGEELVAILPCSDMKEEEVLELISCGADKVYLIDDGRLRHYQYNTYTKVLTDLVREYKPAILLLGATAIGESLAPRVAARLQTGLTAACTELEIDKKEKILRQHRPAIGENIMAAIICPDHRPQMATIKPGMMEKPQRDYSRRGEVIKVNSRIADEDIVIRIIDIVRSRKEAIDLERADVIVSIGRGPEKAEGLKLVEELAAVLNGAVGASRAAVDAGWISSCHQIGQTGKTVRAKLYIACGISGAIQHQVGMRSSEVIVAINNDARAPIFDIATYGIVGDLFQVLPMLTEMLEKRITKP